jgi:hypothetical protein
VVEHALAEEAASLIYWWPAKSVGIFGGMSDFDVFLTY